MVKAESFLLRALSISTLHFGELHEETVRTRQDLGAALKQIDKSEVSAVVLFW